MEEQPENEGKKKKKKVMTTPLSAVELLVSGAAAGMVSRTLTAPLDRVRILYQVDPQRSFTLKKGWKTLGTIQKNTGLAGLFRGHGATLLRLMPQSAITFAAYDRYNRLLMRLFGGPTVDHTSNREALVRFFAGAFAGATAQTIVYPLDLVRARMAAHWNLNPRYPNYFAAFSTVIKTEGFFALFNGLSPALWGVLPYAGLNFSIFETLKMHIRKYGDYKTDKDIPSMLRLLCGGLAGLIAQTATYPIHIVKRRMQVAQGPLYRSLWHGIHTIYQQEGLKKGLFKGMVLTWFRGPIAVALGFYTNDFIKSKFREYHKLDVQDEMRIYADEDPIGSSAIDAAIPTIHSLLAGGIAGATAKTVIAPGDRIKILYQVNPNKSFTLSKALDTGIRICKTNGVIGLWRGNGATVLRVAPYAAISYACYDRYEIMIETIRGQPTDVYSKFVAGALAGSTATALTYPLDLVRARMAAHWNELPRYFGYMSAFQEIAKTEGKKSLLNGLKPTLIGIVPYAGTSYAIYNTLKSNYVHNFNIMEENINPMVRLSMGGLAGLVAQSLTYPLDIIRRRMQVHSPPYESITVAFKDILEKEGWRGFYKGLSMNWIKGPIAVAVSFNVNDHIKHRFSEIRKQQHEE